MFLKTRIILEDFDEQQDLVQVAEFFLPYNVALLLKEITSKYRNSS